MKKLAKTVRDSIAAAMRAHHQQMEEQRLNAVKNAVDDYLIRHPDWQPSTARQSCASNTKQKPNVS
jgi:hypothetical protein